MATTKKIPKIGIFGWTGTGKTTYLSIFQYLISYHYHPYIKNSFVDNKQIQKNIHILLEKDLTWEEIPSRIKNTETSYTVRFKIDTEDGFQEFDIDDYTGESIAIKENESKIQDERYNYFLDCDAILFFLDASMFEEEDELSNRQRWEEFQLLLQNLYEKNHGEIDIPFYLVITKADNIPGTKNEYENIEDFIKERYFEIYKLLKNFGSEESFFTSSKVCFEEYIINKSNDNREAVKFSAPILISLGDILEKREEERKKKRTIKMTLWLAKIGIIILSALILMTWSYNFLYTKYDNEISDLIYEHNIKKLKQYKIENTSLKYFPSLKKKLNEPILKTKEQDFNEILESSKDHENYRVTVKLITDFQQNFPNSENENKKLNLLYNQIGNRLVSQIRDKKSKDYTKKLKIIESLRKHLPRFRDSDELDEWKYEFEEKEKQQIAKEKDDSAYQKILKNKEDYDSVIKYSSEYLNNIKDGRRYEKVQKISQDAEIVKKIHETEKSNYNIILDLCQQHKKLHTGYFRSKKVTATPCANAGVAQKNYEKEMKKLLGSDYKDYL